MYSSVPHEITETALGKLLNCCPHQNRIGIEQLLERFALTPSALFFALVLTKVKLVVFSLPIAAHSTVVPA